MRVDPGYGSNGYWCKQYVWTGLGGYVVTRTKIDGSGWSEWEWENPPMLLGVEYRTTERYLGKPVYKKLVRVASISANSVLPVPIADGIQSIVFAHTFSITNNQFENAGLVSVTGGTASGITLTNNYSLALTNYDVLVAYTKTTD